MLAIAVAFLAHELLAEIQIRLILIVGPAAQRDVVHVMPAAFSVGLFVMVLHRACAPAAVTLVIEESATTPVALPYLASDRRGYGASSAVASSFALSFATFTSIAGAGSVDERGLLLERIVEEAVDGARHDDRGVWVREPVAK